MTVSREGRLKSVHSSTDSAHQTCHCTAVPVVTGCICGRSLCSRHGPGHGIWLLSAAPAPPRGTAQHAHSCTPTAAAQTHSNWVHGQHLTAFGVNQGAQHWATQNSCSCTSVVHILQAHRAPSNLSLLRSSTFLEHGAGACAMLVRIVGLVIISCMLCL